MDLLGILQSSSSSSSSTSDENVEVIPNVILPELLQELSKNENFVENTVPLYNEQQFIQHFRLSRQLVQQLKVEFETSEYYPKKDTGFKRITSEKCILAFLWFSANEAVSLRDVADRFDISVSTLHNIVDNVAKFLSNKANEVIVWPSPVECRRICEEFTQMGFPGVIGCIDGTHIRIDTPSEDAESYINRKKYHSIQMQVVCDNRLIRDVFIGYPGSVHDARVFRNSPPCNSLAEVCLLCDSAYPTLRNLLTPYKDTGNLSSTQKKFNKNLSHCRVLIEHTIGLLKQRFRQLYHLKSRNVYFICHFIRACCVVHNMCTRNNIEEYNVDEMENENREEIINILNDDVQEEADEVGLNYRNYVAAILDI
ncbi:hypothetical protein NQ314_011296 [Rhamnusium bicolor]|uniref:DDE Tnp4 domain-containing protein n=1 Tax=Rhamnusium bicolor TaxID=1586634 RepID=A0AAV8XK35_9CUCU|nr:hypothetical protein NQ314_011296 [Rhamnusium bicolor]